ncbi:hypothetical protein BGY98DRAFT_1101393 [Russula aff. rugulosa BPL654]|nr:hypothetical protein BGY98DRAFT_1101393 [Russula aff. rugulosa BPL654]
MALQTLPSALSFKETGNSSTSSRQSISREVSSTLINCKGRYVGGPDVELAVVNVVKGKRSATFRSPSAYRFRLVSISCDLNFTFSIDEHEMTVIEVDGTNGPFNVVPPPHLLHQIKTASKWQVKTGFLTILDQLVVSAPQRTAKLMPDIVPILSEAIWDTKADVKKQARESLTKATALISNKDIEQFIPALIQSLINPVEEVFKTIQLLSATTFVSEVDSPTLSLMVLFWLVVSWKSRLPPSARLLSSSTTCPSSSTRLSQFHPFLPKLLPGLIKVETTIGNPEACSVVGRAIATPSGWRGPYW